MRDAIVRERPRAKLVAVSKMAGGDSYDPCQPSVDASYRALSTFDAIFCMNKLCLTWMEGEPMPANMVADILKAVDDPGTAPLPTA